LAFTALASASVVALLLATKNMTGYGAHDLINSEQITAKDCTWTKIENSVFPGYGVFK